MTGFPRWVIALLGLVIGGVAVIAAILLVGAARLCGSDENQELKGYCAAGDTVRFLVVAIPAATVILGYLLSLWTGRLTPIAIAALCAIAEGLAALVAGY
jgi:hypothetical protein